jgi:hypothetical protein
VRREPRKLLRDRGADNVGAVFHPQQALCRRNPHRDSAALIFLNYFLGGGRFAAALLQAISIYFLISTYFFFKRSFAR